MFDGATVELHLIYHSLGISDNTIGIFTIKAINPLSPGELPELITIEDHIFPPLNKRYLHDSKINILKLPEKCIEDEQWYDTDIAGNSSNKAHYLVDTDYADISAGDYKIFHK